MNITAQVTWDYTNTDGITMGLLDNVEKRLDRIVNGSFSKAFKAQIKPEEIADAVQHEIDMRARQQDGRIVAPNRFVIALSTEDYRTLEPFMTGLKTELAAMVKKHCFQQRYATIDLPEVRFAEDTALHVGDVRIDSEAGLRQNVEARATTAHENLIPPIVADQAVTPHLRATDGTDYPLDQPVVTIGRTTEADIQINDPGISRIHCTILLGSQVMIRDNQSTNGTLVDGQKITEAPLNHGSLIQIGNSTFSYLSR